MKKLLHLYNLGHDPFPHIGKGGLGYHLPQYKKRGEGLHLNKYTGKYEYDGNYDDLNVYDQEVIIGEYTLDNDEDDDFNIEDEEDDEYGDNTFFNITLQNDSIAKIPFNAIEGIPMNYDYDPYEFFEKLNEVYTVGQLKGIMNQVTDLTSEEKLLPKEQFIDLLIFKAMKDKRIKEFMDVEVERGILLTGSKENTVNEQTFDSIPTDPNTEELNELFQGTFDTSFDQLYNDNGNNLKEENTYNMKDENEASKFKEMFIIDDPLIVQNENGDDCYVKVKSIDKEGVEGKSYISQNTYDSGKDFEEKLLQNPELLLAVIKQVFGNETTMAPVVIDPNATPEQKYAGFDSYKRVITVGGVEKTLFIELKKYDNYYDIVKEMNESKEDFRNFLANKIKDTDLLNIQKEKKTFELNKRYFTEDEYANLLKYYDDRQQKIRDDLITNFKYNYNKEFSFLNGNSMNMKYLKLPLYTGKSNIEGNFKNRTENIDKIKAYQENPHKTRKTTKEELTSAVTGSNDILYVVLTKGGLLAQSYKQYIDKFYNDEIKDYSDKHHIIRTSRLKHSAYSKSKNAPIDSYGLNVHNMICINTKDVPLIPENILNVWKKKTADAKWAKIQERYKNGTLKYQLIPIKK
jgi:hypothetical protein